MSYSLKEEHYHIEKLVEDWAGGDWKGQHGEKKVMTECSLRVMVTKKVHPSSPKQDLEMMGSEIDNLALSSSLKTEFTYW